MSINTEVLSAPAQSSPPLAWLTSGPVLRLVSAAIVFGAWEYAGRVPISPAFPTFWETMEALWGMIADGRLVHAYLITLEPLLIGLGASIVLGVGIGLLMGLSRFSEWLIAPIFIIAQSAPLAALIPILTFAYGIGLASKVQAHAWIADRDGAILSRQPAPADPEDHPALGRADDLRRAAPGLRGRLHRHRAGRAADHADRHRRHHHLQPVGGGVP
jgi:hypothetical protein